MRDSLKQIIQFVGIGAINTGVDFVAFNILLVLFGVPTTALYIAFRSIAFFVGNINSYFLNTRFTFNSDRTTKNFWNFFAATIIGFLVNTVIATVVFSLIKNTHFPQLIIANLGVVVGTVASMAVNFLLYKYVVFGKK